MKNKTKRIIAAALVMAAVFMVGSGAFAQEVDISAKGAVLIDGRTRKVLYAKTAHERLPMASTTKVMTAILAIESGNLDAIVTVPEAAYGVEGSSMYLRLGEKISLRDLVYGLMLVSGNDAAVAIAIHVGGSVEGFAAMMNKKAKSLGALNTNFVTPNGLPDPNHYTTAYDLALIAAYAMENATFREVVSTTYYKTTTGEVARTVKNKNKILWEYEGGNGIKTGYTMAAGKCLVFAAERDGMQLIGVVLNCPDMFPAAKRILDYGFNTYKPETIIHAGDMIACARVTGGKKSTLALEVKEDIIILLREGDATTVRTVVKAAQEVPAPVAAGDILGTLEVWEGDHLLATAELAAAESIDTNAFPDYLTRLFRRWSV